MTRSRPALAVACAVIGATSAVADGNVKAGRQKALQCQAGHGLDGQAKIPDAPNLAGKTEIYLAKSMKDYRSGARQNEMMSLVAQKLKDDDIADLAAYYTAIQVTLGQPPR